MGEREQLDRHVVFFPEEGAYIWRVVKSEEHLAEERFAGRLAPDSVSGLTPRLRPKSLRERQQELWELPSVGVDGNRV